MNVIRARPSRLIERLITEGGHGPVYGPNLRVSCRRMELDGLLRTLAHRINSWPSS